MKSDMLALVPDKESGLGQVDPEVEKLARVLLKPKISLEDYLRELEQKMTNLGMLPSRLTGRAL